MSIRCLGCMGIFDEKFNICPHCGYAIGTKADAVHLQPGTVLHGRFLVGKVLGAGGFGITYAGWDNVLEQKVAIKEYMPGVFATRSPDRPDVIPFEGNKGEYFRTGLKKYLDEAKRLAKFQNEEGIVKVFDNFEENGTAYMIMEYIDGESIASYLKREGPIPEDKAVEMLMPAIRAVGRVHEKGLLHRDIAPDNIILTKSGEAKLIDFGCSRYMPESSDQSMTVFYKTGYTPEEQYRSHGDQGEFTDVYALAATLYKMVTGHVPPDAMQRRSCYEKENKEILTEPHKLCKISRSREIAILNALNVRAEDRTADVKTFINELNADPPAKRRYGRIKKIDLYFWPLWLKIAVPAAATVLVLLAVLLFTGVFDFSKYSKNADIPDNIVVVPDVEGKKDRRAVSDIEDTGLVAEIEGNLESEFVPAGTVIVQSPVGGSYAQINSLIGLSLSAGKGVAEPENGIATVPFLIGDTEEKAREKLKKAGLGEPVTENVHDEYIHKGLVVSISIENGDAVQNDDKVATGTVLKIKLSLGPETFTIPIVVGIAEDEALAELEEKKLIVTKEYEKSDDAAPGNVIRQSIDGDTPVKRGDPVTITISSDEAVSKLPNVEGLTQKEAEKQLKKNGNVVCKVENYDDDVPTGTVISQVPAAGTSQKNGSEVTIIVSKGKKPAAEPSPAATDAAGATVVIPRDTTLTDKPEPTNGGIAEPTQGVAEQTPGLLTGTALFYCELNKDGSGWTVTKYQGGTGPEDVVVPASYGGKPVTDIADDVFKYSNIRSLILPDTIQSIGANAFYECKKLEEIQIPESLRSIGDSAFMNCGLLKEIYIPAGTVGKGAFTNCTGLEEIRFGNAGDIDIGDRAFENCTGLKELDLSDKVRSVGASAFLECTGIKKIILPEGLKRIGLFAFAKTSIEYLYIPDSVIYIGLGQCCYYCDELKQISLPTRWKNDEDIRSLAQSRWDGTELIFREE